MDADVIFILFQMLKYFIKTISYKQIGHTLTRVLWEYRVLTIVIFFSLLVFSKRPTLSRYGKTN